MDLKEEVEAAHGVALAQTALFCALLGVLKSSGHLNSAQVDIVFDAALSQVETSPAIDEALSLRARRVIEVIASELAGPPQKDR